MSYAERLLSLKPIPVEERLILALDVSDVHRARQMVAHLGDSVKFYKLGLELFMAGNYHSFIEWLKARDKKIFVDLKFFDVPRTVGAAVAQLRGQGADFATVHGNDRILEAAVAEKGETKILSVTALTSLDQTDLMDLGFETDPSTLVLSRARRALAIGCDGVISSGLEIKTLRQELGDKFFVVVPGIRPISNIDDQKRTIDVEEAFLSGADYIVVGRPILRAKDPLKVTTSIQNRMAKLFTT